MRRTGLDADLARVLQFMALLKLAFAAAACLVSWRRLARPVTGWRGGAYVAGPPLTVGGSILLLSLHHLGAAALAVHAGLLILVIAASTDRTFFERPHR